MPSVIKFKNKKKRIYFKKASPDKEDNSEATSTVFRVYETRNLNKIKKK